MNSKLIGKIFGIILALFLAGCLTTRPEYISGPMGQFTVAQTTAGGIRVFSQSGMSVADLSSIDQNVAWCQAHGFSTPNNKITVDIATGVLLRPGVYSYNDPQSGWIGGKVIYFDNVRIMVISQSLECIRHELLHVHLWQTTGDADAGHKNSLWKIWPAY